MNQQPKMFWRKSKDLKKLGQRENCMMKSPKN